MYIRFACCLCQCVCREMSVVGNDFAPWYCSKTSHNVVLTLKEHSCQNLLPCKKLGHCDNYLVHHALHIKFDFGLSNCSKKLHKVQIYSVALFVKKKRQWNLPVSEDHSLKVIVSRLDLTVVCLSYWHPVLSHLRALLKVAMAWSILWVTQCSLGQSLSRP